MPHLTYSGSHCLSSKPKYKNLVGNQKPASNRS